MGRKSLTTVYPARPNFGMNITRALFQDSGMYFSAKLALIIFVSGDVRFLIPLRRRTGTIPSDSGDLYEVCPESIGPTFISPRHSVRATSVGHERQQ